MSQAPTPQESLLDLINAIAHGVEYARARFDEQNYNDLRLTLDLIRSNATLGVSQAGRLIRTDPIPANSTCAASNPNCEGQLRRTYDGTIICGWHDAILRTNTE